MEGPRIYYVSSVDFDADGQAVVDWGGPYDYGTAEDVRARFKLERPKALVKIIKKQNED